MADTVDMGGYIANTPEWLKAWGEMQAKAARVRREFYGTGYARTLTTGQLKAMWDCYDGSDDGIGDDRVSGGGNPCGPE